MHLGCLVMLFGVHLPLIGGGGEIIDLFHYGFVFVFNKYVCVPCGLVNLFWNNTSFTFFKFSCDVHSSVYFHYLHVVLR